MEFLSYLGYYKNHGGASKGQTWVIEVSVQRCLHDVQLAEQATHDDQESNEHFTRERWGAEDSPEG